MSTFLQRRPWVGRSLFVSVLILLVGIGLFRLAPVVSPIKEGHAAEFWTHVTGVEFETERRIRSLGSFYQPRDGWFIYYKQGFHGQELYRVRIDEASAAFPKAVKQLRNTPACILNPDVEEGFRRWQRNNAGPNDGFGFIAQVHAARLDRLQPINPKLFEEIRSEQHFNERWQRVGRYHWNVWFEFLFLSGLIVFATWPWIRGAGRWRWAVHLGMLPLLFCLPYWLGYAQFTFTSAGPSGGVAYPYLLGLLRGLPASSFDADIVRRLPQVLEPLSQSPGPMLSLTNFGGPGPLVMLGIGLVVALIAWLFGRSARCA